MSKFRFQILDVRDSSPKEWLREWAGRYEPDDEPEYRYLIENCRSFSAEDFERIGKWKDGAKTELQWRPNVASVAYQIWKEAANELPKCPEQSQVEAFLDYWAGKTYTDQYRNGRVEKHFGPPRATTLLHFVSGGRFPIFDANVRRAISRLLNSTVPPNTVRWYLDSYCSLFSDLAALCECEADGSRLLDKALFSYGSSKGTAISTRSTTDSLHN